MKTKFSISVHEELLSWLDSQIEDKRFASRSHGIQFALNKLKKLEKNGYVTSLS